MRLDVVTEFLRPRELPKEKIKTSTDFFRIAEERKAVKIRVRVQKREDELDRGPFKGRSWVTFFNIYEALDDKGKVIVPYKEDYQGGALNLKDSESPKKRLETEWACIATARNRLRMADEDKTELEIVTLERTFTGEQGFVYLDMQIRDKKAQPLYVLRK
jgi:hypothetical protein